MLTNPIRGKAGKQITAISSASGSVVYTVPVGKYCELGYTPANITITANGVTSMSTPATAIAAPLVLQAGSVVTASGSSVMFFGTEYDA